MNHRVDTQEMEPQGYEKTPYEVRRNVYISTYCHGLSDLNPNKVSALMLRLFGILLITVFNISEVFAQETPASPQRVSTTESDQSRADKDQGETTAGKVQDQSSGEVAPTIEAMTDRELDRRIEGGTGQERLDAIWEDFKRRAGEFLTESSQHREVQGRIFQSLYLEQEQQIERRYKQPITSSTAVEAGQRQESIQHFRSFLETSPPHPQYTPDSLYRLGMLLLEESDASFISRMDEFNRRAAEGGESFDEPMPQRDQLQVVSIFTKLIQDWPQYRELDAALYARGYCYFEMDEKQLALRDFNTIVERFPESEYRTEVWNLIGELHFDFAELQDAIKAYKEVIKDKEAKVYANAYYKLAWTYYRNDQFEEAVEAFKALISYSDDQVAQGKKAFSLRNESMQYLAISLNEDDWDDDGVTDPDAGFKRVKRYLSGNSAYQAELLDQLVGIFFDNTKYEEAIQTALHLFKTHPFYSENPSIHAKIITAYERIAQPERAFLERDRITDVYVKDGPWYAFNHKDQDAIDNARALMKDALLQAGTYHHGRAQSFRSRADEADPSDESSLMAQAKESYMKAALSYQRYLDRYKTDENTYELLYLFAEALYYSEDYQRAFEQYLVVRDSALDTIHKEEAGFSSILSHNQLVQAAILSKQLAPKPSLSAQVTTLGEQASADQSPPSPTGSQKVEPEEIPSLVQQALQIREEYLSLGLTSEDDPHRLALQTFKIGEINMDYLHYPEARQRFVTVIDKYPQSPVAFNAAVLLIATYQGEKDWDAVATWADYIAAANLGPEALAKAKIWKAGALFERASVLEAQKRYKEAAQEYISLVDQNPQSDFAVSALNNAAVAFEQARMFDSAMRTYERIFQEYPKSDFAENALFRVAFNAQRFYDYDRALRTFQQLAKRYPDGERAAQAAYNAARLLEQTQQYSEAAKALQEFAKRFPDHEMAAACFFDVGKNYEKLGDDRKQISIYEQFIKRYGDEPKESERVIIALSKMIAIFERQGDSRKVQKTRERLIKTFEAKSLPPGSYAASFAAESAFKLIEPRFQAFERMKIKGNMRMQGKIITKMKEEIAGLTEDYALMQRFKSLEWNIASFYRIGILRQLFAQALYDLPIPDGLTPEMEDIYTTQIEELAIPIEDEAVSRFETAYAKAREFKISNEWTKKILLSLNKYKPAEYPTFKDEKRLGSETIISNSGFLLPEAAQEAEAVTTPEEAKTSTDPKAEQTTEASADEKREVQVGKREVKGLGQERPEKPQEEAEGLQGERGTSQDEASPLEETDPLEEIEELE